MCMTFRLLPRWAAVLLTIVAATFGNVARAGDFPNGVRDTLGPQFGPATQNVLAKPMRRGPGAIETLRYWNQIAIDATGLDHTPPAAGETRGFGEQLGPGRASRAMAIVHIAMFDALDAITGRYESYTPMPRAAAGASMDAAIAQAAHDTLVAMFPSQRTRIDGLLAEDLEGIRNGG